MTKQIIMHLRIFGIFFWLIGAVLLSLWMYSISYYYQLGMEQFPSFEASFSILKTLINYHFNTLLFLSTTIGGILIFKLKKYGYILSLINTSVLSFITIRAFIISQTSEIQGNQYQYWTIILPLFFLSSLAFLLNKTKREFFQLNTKNVILITLIIAISIIDSLLTSSGSMAN